MNTIIEVDYAKIRFFNSLYSELSFEFELNLEHKYTKSKHEECENLLKNKVDFTMKIINVDDFYYIDKIYETSGFEPLFFKYLSVLPKLIKGTNIIKVIKNDVILNNVKLDKIYKPKYRKARYTVDCNKYIKDQIKTFIDAYNKFKIENPKDYLTIKIKFINVPSDSDKRKMILRLFMDLEYSFVNENDLVENFTLDFDGNLISKGRISNFYNRTSKFINNLIN